MTEAVSTHIGEGVGMLSFMLRCRLQYDAPRGGEPPSVIVKLEPTGESYRKNVESWRGLEREIRFYRDIAQGAPFPVPAFYHGDYDEHRAVMVLEDLGHHGMRNQVFGLKNEETLAAVREIARLHARYWDSDELGTLDWMPVDDDRLTMSYTETWAPFEEVYGLRIGKDAVALGRRIGDSLDWLRAEMEARPHTVCHGDLRADNLFFGDPGPPDEVVIFDWQVCTRCFGALDVTRLLGGSEPAAERGFHHMELFAAWHETLLSEGVKGYDFETAVADLRLGSLVNCCTPVRILSYWGAEAGGRQGQLLDTIAIGMFTSAVEIDAGARFE